MVSIARPLITQDNALVVQRNCDPELLAITEYEVMIRPPLFVGARHVIVAAEAVVATRSIVGAVGTVGNEYVDVVAIEVPMALVAVTEIVTAAPGVMPVTEQVRANGLVGTHDPVELVTEYA